MLLTLPLEVWEIIFDLLPGRDLQLITEVPTLRDILATARRTAHRLEAYRAGFVDVTLPGSRPLADRTELLKAFRARWESLRWTGVTRLPPRALWIYHFTGDMLAYIPMYRAPVVQCLWLPFGKTSPRSWEVSDLGLEHGIKTFSAYPEKNLLAVLEEWFVDGMPSVRLHVRGLNSSRDIVVPRNERTVVCQAFTAEIELNVDIQPEQLSCEVEQIGHYIAILFACFTRQGPDYCAKFIMWDLTAQEQVANITSREYRSFVFLDRRWVLFGAIRNHPEVDLDRMHHPFLEIVDPTSPSHTTKLELEKSVVKHGSAYTTVDISVGSPANCEGSSLTRDGGVSFVSGNCRGLLSADVYCCHRNPWEVGSPRYEARVSILNIEDVLSMAPSPSDPEQRYIEWKDLASSVAMFSYTSTDGDDRYRIFSRHSYVAGFRYVSPIQPLHLELPMGPRCFFVYDFNPHRGTSDPLPRAAPEDTDPETGHHKCASEITREVVGGLNCWKMRFDLPAAGEDVEKCHVGLTDGGVVLFELCGLGGEVITVFSMW